MSTSVKQFVLSRIHWFFFRMVLVWEQNRQTKPVWTTQVPLFPPSRALRCLFPSSSSGLDQRSSTVSASFPYHVSCRPPRPDEQTLPRWEEGRRRVVTNTSVYVEPQMFNQRSTRTQRVNLCMASWSPYSCDENAKHGWKCSTQGTDFILFSPSDICWQPDNLSLYNWVCTAANATAADWFDYLLARHWSQTGRHVMTLLITSAANF